MQKKNVAEQLITIPRVPRPRGSEAKFAGPSGVLYVVVVTFAAGAANTETVVNMRKINHAC